MFDSWQQVIQGADGLIPPPGRPRRKKAAATTTARQKLTVVVVDDERLIADTMQEILTLAGFHTLCAYDGNTALALTLKIKPDYVLTDVVMPGMNGVELAVSIRKALPATDILLLSGQAGITNLLDQGRDEGYSFELLAKPIHPERLIERLKKK